MFVEAFHCSVKYCCLCVDGHGKHYLQIAMVQFPQSDSLFRENW